MPRINSGETLDIRDTLYSEVTIATNTPGAISTGWTGCINDSSWQGKPPHTWRCAACEFDRIDVETTPYTYLFAFTFEYNQDTWDNDTTIVFINPRTGKPPHYETRNFSNTF